MPITPAIDNWLLTAGYEYHCFISWAHTKNRVMTECARTMKHMIEDTLALSIPNPRVFLDEEEIPGGADWEAKLLRALCRSVSMVSICAPIYYHPSHRWCGLEWAAMERLSQRRLLTEEIYSIIPLLLRTGDELPSAVAKIQYIDFSRILVRGPNYYRTNDFREKVQKIVNQIEIIAQLTVRNGVAPDCASFELPTDSAFIDYELKALGLPFRTWSQRD
jgi:hypothetical protein